MSKTTLAAIGLLAPVVTLAQQTQPKSSPVVTAIITWLPFIFLICLWIFFMRRMNLFGKGGYRDYMRVTQERIERIEVHLGDIAASLRKIADESSSRRGDGNRIES